MRIALINTNRIIPPIAPIGLDYVAEAVQAAGYDVNILDLCWEEDWESAIQRFFEKNEYGLIGVTLRNIDDCFISSRHSFLTEFASMVDAIKKRSGATVILGGVGFSIMPKEVLILSGADAGIRGDGEFFFPLIAERIERNENWTDLSNLVFFRDGQFISNPISFPSLDRLPPMSRSFINNTAYYEKGGQAGVEMKRGCPGQCVYCAEPLAKGRRPRLRSPQTVVDEMENLLKQGIDHFHTCDSEFNIPIQHAFAVCEEIIQRKLGDRIRWYAYCSPHPFSHELASTMRRAGCVGINFGVDSGDEDMLKHLRRDYPPEAIANAIRACKDEGIVVMLDLLLGAPGESRESLVRSIEFMRHTSAEKVGVSLGARIYPGTELEKMLENRKEDWIGGDDLTHPVFFIEPEIASSAAQLIHDQIQDDERFFFSDPTCPDRSYNYNANQKLAEAIQNGMRGAHWDILRRMDNH